MAEEQEEKTESPDDAAAAPAPRKKLPLLIGAVAVVLAVGGGGTFFLLRGGGPSDAKPEGTEEHADAEPEGSEHGAGAHDEKPADEHGEKTDAHAAPEGHGESGDGGAGPPPPQFVSIDPFVVNVADGEKDRFLKLKLDLEVSGPEVAKELEQRLPQVKDVTIALLSSQSAAELRTLQGKDVLRSELHARLNALVKQGVVRQVLFTEFVIQ